MSEIEKDGLVDDINNGPSPLKRSGPSLLKKSDPIPTAIGDEDKFKSEKTRSINDQSNDASSKKATDDSNNVLNHTPSDRIIPDESKEANNIWDSVYQLVSEIINDVYNNVPEPREHHKLYENEGYATCCPNCANVHLRGDCLYDVTDLVLYYMATEPTDSDSQKIIATLTQCNIGGIDFTTQELTSRPVHRKSDRYSLKITCKDAIKALCKTVLYMDAASDNPAKPSDGDSMKGIFEKATGWSVLKHYPSVYTLANSDKNPSEDKSQEKKVEVSEIESVLRLLYESLDKIICDVAIDSSLKVYDDRRESSIIENMFLLRCRKCGMPVALTAGQFDEIIVGMLGLTSAGKSSIIYAINYWISNQIQNINIPNCFGEKVTFTLGFEYNQYDVGSGPRRQDRELFAKKMSIIKTDKDVRFHSTIVVTLFKDNTLIKTINLVLIDIAGEITYGTRLHPIYYCSNCFWFCLLPGQNGVEDGTIITSDEDLGKRTKFYSDLFKEINNGREKNIPVAVIYTRSDCYLKMFGSTHNIEYICSSSATDRKDNISSYLMADSSMTGIRVDAIRDASMKILQFMANIRDKQNRNYLSELASIEVGDSVEIPLGRSGDRCRDRLSFFEADCRYSVFACSPYGDRPIDGEKKEKTDEHSEAERRLRICENKVESLKEELEHAQTELINAKEAMNDELDQNEERKRKLNRDVLLATKKLKMCKTSYDEAIVEYIKATDEETDACIAKEAAEQYYNAMDKENNHPSPFGIMLPVIWSLCLDGNFLLPLVMNDGMVKIVDDDWLTINKQGTIQIENIEPEPFMGRFTSAFEDIIRSFLRKK